MKTLIIFDSFYGNTEIIARAVGKAIGKRCTSIFHVGGAVQTDLESFDLIIVGSPVHGGRPTHAVEKYLEVLTQNALKNIYVASFDTRFEAEERGSVKRIRMNIIRYASERIAKQLVRKGGVLIVPPEGFIVKNKEGTLRRGEIARAAIWGKHILENVRSDFHYAKP